MEKGDSTKDERESKSLRIKPIFIDDMPKLQSPFVRKEINGIYVVTPEINPGYEWVFDDKDVIAVEKLHGTNVSILIRDGVITGIWNRTERLPFFNKGKSHIIRGVINSFEKGYMEFLSDGQHFGELIGPKINGNPYNLKGNLWIPFNGYARKHLSYKSWGKYPKDFTTISNWFKELMPLLNLRLHAIDDQTRNEILKSGFVEGVVFTHPDGRMAKLRKDMFDWFQGPRHKEVETGDEE
jgi:hypothetical protein